MPENSWKKLFKDGKCFFCSKVGHTSMVCRKKMKANASKPSNKGHKKSNFELKQLMDSDDSNDSDEVRKSLLARYLHHLQTSNCIHIFDRFEDVSIFPFMTSI